MTKRRERAHFNADENHRKPAMTKTLDRLIEVERKRRNLRIIAHLNVHNLDPDDIALGLDDGEYLIISKEGEAVVVDDADSGNITLHEGEIIVNDEPPVANTCDHPYYQDGHVVARCSLPHGSEHVHGAVNGVASKLLRRKPEKGNLTKLSKQRVVGKRKQR